MFLFFLPIDICTGQAPGTILTDSTNANIFYKCGECSPEVITCPVGQKYDAQCLKCVTNAFPDCDQRGML